MGKSTSLPCGIFLSGMTHSGKWGTCFGTRTVWKLAVRKKTSVEHRLVYCARRIGKGCIGGNGGLRIRWGGDLKVSRYRPVSGGDCSDWVGGKVNGGLRVVLGYSKDMH